jgi:hypothetical protein
MGVASLRDVGCTVMPLELVDQDGVGGHRQELSIVVVSTRVRLLSPVVPPEGCVGAYRFVWGRVLWSCCMSGVLGWILARRI